MADQAVENPGRGGGRSGRGRGRGSAKNPATRAVAANAAKSKVGPTRLLEAEWTKDSLLKENCFVIWLGSGPSGSQQWTVHHPVGETALPPGAWVMTPARDLGFLLARRDSEELSAWKRRSELAKRQEVLRARMGRRLDGQTEVWTFDGATAIQPTIRTCMTAAKAADAKESEWLSYADTAVQVAERSFKEALRTQATPRGWLQGNPKPVHETMGGPLGDHPQKAIPFLKGKSVAAAKDKVIRVAIGMDHTDDASDSESEDEAVDEEATPVATRPKVELERKARTSRSHSRENSQGSAASSSSKKK